MVSLLTGTSNGVLDTARMPGTDTSDLTQTLVRLPGQLLGMPTGGHTLESFSLGNTNDVDHLVLGEDLLDGDLLFELLLANIVLPLKAGFGKGLLFRFAPVLVEATLALDVDVLSPDGLERTEATRGLDVANHA